MPIAKADKIQTLQYAGGVIHDWEGCGNTINAALKPVKEMAVTQVNDDLDCFKKTALKPFDLAVLYHTGGKLTDPQKNGLLNWVAAGGGVVGIHSAADSFRPNPEYVAMIGGVFVTHPAYRDYLVSVADSEHPITAGLEEFWVKDEQYVTDYDPRNNVLATALYRGAITPVIWTRTWGEGRVCWIALGHDPAACQQDVFVKLLRRACFWAAGREVPNGND